jgi:hypothetical protein
MAVQISFLTQGGSGTEVPDISIEVDDVDEAYRLMKKSKFKIEYDMTDEPWGVRRSCILRAAFCSGEEIPTSAPSLDLPYTARM